jgi:hypothetical protein
MQSATDDPLAVLLWSLHETGAPPDGWSAQWVRGKADPLHAAWKACRDPHAMLELLRVHGVADGLVSQTETVTPMTLGLFDGIPDSPHYLDGVFRGEMVGRRETERVTLCDGTTFLTHAIEPRAAAALRRLSGLPPGLAATMDAIRTQREASGVPAPTRRIVVKMGGTFEVYDALPAVGRPSIERMTRPPPRREGSGATTPAGPASRPHDMVALDERLEDLCPIDGGRARLCLRRSETVGVSEDKSGALCATLEVIVLATTPAGEVDDRALPARTAKATVRLVLERHRVAPPARVNAYLAGWARAVARVLREAPSLAGVVPKDLVAPDVLGLADADTPEQFTEALLERARLGRLLALE